MKDPARLALAIAAILTATAFDAQQSSSRHADHDAKASIALIREVELADENRYARDEEPALAGRIADETW